MGFIIGRLIGKPFLYLNFRKYPKPTEQEIEAQFMQARKERAESVRQTVGAGQSQVPEDVTFFQDLEEKQKFSDAQQYDLSGQHFWNVWSGMQSS